MSVNNHKIVKCLVISVTGKIYCFKTDFNLEINGPDNSSQNKMSLPLIIENMKSLYDCNHYKPKIAKSIYPENSYYYAFFQSDFENINAPYNKIGTHIINGNYNTFKKDNNIKCYGKCYILCINNFFDVYDCALNDFISSHNLVYTINGAEERKDTEKIFKDKLTNQCFLYDDYIKMEQEFNCIFM